MATVMIVAPRSAGASTAMARWSHNARRRAPRLEGRGVLRSSPKVPGVDVDGRGTYVRIMGATALPEERLESLYVAPGFGGETTARAKVIRELIDEIRRLRHELQRAAPRLRPDGAGR